MAEQPFHHQEISRSPEAQQQDAHREHFERMARRRCAETSRCAASIKTTCRASRMVGRRTLCDARAASTPTGEHQDRRATSSPPWGESGIGQQVSTCPSGGSILQTHRVGYGSRRRAAPQPQASRASVSPSQTRFTRRKRRENQATRQTGLKVSEICLGR